MTDRLNGKRIAFLVANEGVEEVELTKPWDAVRGAGGQAVLIAPDAGHVQCVEGDLDRKGTYRVDLVTADADSAEFDALVLPGGVANPDKLRLDDAAVELVRTFVRAGKPVAAICHGPWTLVEAGVVEGKTLTSWPSLRTDIGNAGGGWRDEQVHTDDSGGWMLVTSRKPDDLDAFCASAVEAFAAAPVGG